MFSAFLTTTVLLGIKLCGFDRHIWDVPRTLYNRAAMVRASNNLILLLSLTAHRYNGSARVLSL